MKRGLFSTILVLLFWGVASSQILTTSQLPIFVIETENGAPIVNEPKTPAHLGIIWNGDGEMNNINDAFNHYDGQIGIEIRGSSSQWFPKNNYALETQNPDGTSLDTTMLGFPKENDWVLHGPYSDKTLMRNALAYTIASWIMPYAPRVRYCEVVINGDYKGVYVFTEKIKRDKNRVNISQLNQDEVSGDDVTGGYILKFDKFDGLVSDGFPSAYPAMPGGLPGGTTYQYHYPKPDEIVIQQKQYIQGYIADFEDVMASPGFADPVTGYRSILDVGSVMDMIFIQEISRNVDGYRLSTYMYKDKESVDNRLHLGPVWDYNLGFSNVDYCIGPDYTGWAIDFNDSCPGDFWVVHFWWQKLFDEPSFRIEMRDEWVRLRQDTLSNERILGLVDSLEDLLTVPAVRNFQRWPTLNEYVWPNPVVTGSYAGEVARLREWLINRLAWMDGEMEVLADTSSPLPPLGPIVQPNLFQKESKLIFRLPSQQRVSFELFDIQGRLVEQSTKFYEGQILHEVPIAGNDLPPGMYFYRVRSGKKAPATGKLVKY